MGGLGFFLREYRPMQKAKKAKNMPNGSNRWSIVGSLFQAHHSSEANGPQCHHEVYVTSSIANSLYTLNAQVTAQKGIDFAAGLT